MNKNIKVFTIYEYDNLTVTDFDDTERKTISKETFSKLCNFVSYISPNLLKNEKPILVTSYKKGIQYISFQNYVGSFMLDSNIIFEILPKIYSINNDVEYSRKIVLSMLRRCLKINYKNNIGVVDKVKLPIFEIYIELFINSVNQLLKSGLKSSYNVVEENVGSLKGKIIFNKQATKNYIHKERFFVEHDDYNLNRPENRILKSTLMFLKSITQSSKNLRSIRRALLFFDLIDESTNFIMDLALCVPNKLVAEYNDAIFYAKIFLQGFGFSIFGNEFKTAALLFSMYDLYEEYVFLQLRDLLISQGYSVKDQDKTLHLFTKPQKFWLKPDIVVKKDNLTYIFDTKWKLLNNEYNNYGIDSSDMYQMYVYHKRYPNVKKVVLLYPLGKINENLVFLSEEVRIEAKFVKLPIEDYYSDFKKLIKDALTSLCE